jgi:hypothetical protein
MIINSDALMHIHIHAQNCDSRFAHRHEALGDSAPGQEGASSMTLPASRKASVSRSRLFSSPLKQRSSEEALLLANSTCFCSMGHVSCSMDVVYSRMDRCASPAATALSPRSCKDRQSDDEAIVARKEDVSLTEPSVCQRDKMHQKRFSFDCSHLHYLIHGMLPFMREILWKHNVSDLQAHTMSSPTLLGFGKRRNELEGTKNQAPRVILASKCHGIVLSSALL